MEKSTFDSEPPIDQFFVSKPNSLKKASNHHRLQLNLDLMASSSAAPTATSTTTNHQHQFSSSGFEFFMNSNDNHRITRLDSGDYKRDVVLDEMDFFSSDKNRFNSIQEPVIKKEDSHTAASSFNFDVNTGLNLLTANTVSDQSTVDDDGISPIDEKRSKNELVALQAELDRMNTENGRLRGMLNQVSNNYNALQMHLVTLMKQNSSSKTVEQESTHLDHQIVDRKLLDDSDMVPRQFMDPGPSSATPEIDETSNSSSEGRRRDHSTSPTKNEIVLFDAQNNGRDEDGQEQQAASQGWNNPNKIAKLSSASKTTTVEQTAAAEATMRKARVSVRARSEAPMITDGCQWRKYGQKMAKGNPCPRAYYRCTMAVGCPVRKQVQRCAEDRTILITTYEGNHSHPLPPAAMAMASTTSTAASMLLSGSMSSADGLMNSNFLTRTLLPCSTSMATISASAPFPTVTLDLTQNPNNPLQFQRPNTPTQFHLPFMNQPHQTTAQGFGQTLYNQSKFSGLQMSQNGDSSSSSQYNNHLPHQHQSQQASILGADTLSAATAAITADPNFTAALAAAISSIMGGGSSHQQNNNSTSNSTENNNKINTSNFSGH